MIGSNSGSAQTLMIFFASLHLYSSVGGVDVFYDFILRKICGFDKTFLDNTNYILDNTNYILDNTGKQEGQLTKLDMMKQPNELKGLNVLNVLLDSERSYFKNFFFESHYLPTVHFVFFLYLLTLLAQDKINCYALLLGIAILIYSFLCYIFEYVHLRWMKDNWAQSVEPNLFSFLKKRESRTSLDDAPLRSFLKAKQILRYDNFDNERRNRFYFCNGGLLCFACFPLLLCFISLPLFIALMLLYCPSMQIFVRLRDDVRKTVKEFIVNRYWQITGIFIIFVVTHLIQDCSQRFITIALDDNYILLSALPYLFDILITHQKAKYISKKILEIHLKLLDNLSFTLTKGISFYST